MMGNGSAFREGRFDGYFAVDTVANVKILFKTEILDNPDASSNTPMHSHTANTRYACMNKDFKIVQVAVYENNIKVKEFDWGHYHNNTAVDGVHVHDYIDGERQRARSPQKEEREEYIDVYERRKEKEREDILKSIQLRRTARVHKSG